MKFIKLISIIKMNRKIKKKLILAKLNKQELQLIKILIKINIIIFCKKEEIGVYLIKLNLRNNLKIKNLIKKKKIYIKKNRTNVIIGSSSNGINVLNKNGGLCICAISL